LRSVGPRRGNACEQAQADIELPHAKPLSKTVKDLVALIKANPGKFTYASGGVGTQGHLTFERFR
jgi:hypothetical protein